MNDHPFWSPTERVLWGIIIVAALVLAISKFDSVDLEWLTHSNEIAALVFVVVLFPAFWMIMRSDTALGRWMRSSAEKDVEAHQQELSGARPDNGQTSTGTRIGLVRALVVVVVILLLAVWAIIQQAIDRLTAP